MMKQEQTQQGTQLNSAAFEGQRLVREDVVPSARPDTEKRRVHRCANCDIEFFWSPTIVQNKAYCCTGCAAGGPCTCDYSLYSSVTIMGIIYYDQ
jgi:hypothetical protein